MYKWEKIMWPIGTATVRFSITASSKNVLLSGCDDDRQPEIAIWLLKPHISLLIALAPYCYFWLSPSLSQSFGGTFFEHVLVENSRFAIGISTASVIVTEI